MGEIRGRKNKALYYTNGFYIYSFNTGEEEIKIVSKKEINSGLKLELYGEWDEEKQQFLIADYTYSTETDARFIVSSAKRLMSAIQTLQKK